MVSFPYPEKGDVARPLDEGCYSCVHTVYCQAWYWFKTSNKNRSATQGLGTSCLSWSNQEADRITVVTEADLDDNDYMNNYDLAHNPDMNDEVQPISSSNRYRGGEY